MYDDEFLTTENEPSFKSLKTIYLMLDLSVSNANPFIKYLGRMKLPTEKLDFKMN